MGGPPKSAPSRRGGVRVRALEPTGNGRPRRMILTGSGASRPGTEPGLQSTAASAAPPAIRWKHRNGGGLPLFSRNRAVEDARQRPPAARFSSPTPRARSSRARSTVPTGRPSRPPPAPHPRCPSSASRASALKRRSASTTTARDSTTRHSDGFCSLIRSSAWCWEYHSSRSECAPWCWSPGQPQHHNRGSCDVGWRIHRHRHSHGEPPRPHRR